MKKTPLIVIVAPVPPPSGGMAIQAQILRRHLLAEGFETLLIATNPPLPLGLQAVPGGRTILQSGLFFYRLFVSIPRAAVVHVFAASHFYFFARVLPTIVLARIFCRRVIANYRGGEAERFFARFGFVARPVLRLASGITVPSAFLVRCFKRENLQTAVVRNLIDLERFSFRERNALEPHFVVNRNLEPMYNVKLALDAFAIVKRAHPTARLDVIGTGSELRFLKDWVQRTGLADVTFYGAVAHDDMPRHLNRADILLNPTNVDNFPATLLEAFASGLPVISTDVGGIRDLIGEQTAALLVEPNNASAMAEKILWLLSEPERARSLTACAWEIAKRFTWKQVRAQVLDTYFRKGDAIAASAQEGST